MTYKISESIVLPFLASKVYPVEIWNKQCCNKPEVKVLTTAYFTDREDAERFVVLKNIQLKEVKEKENNKKVA